jgi:hypothetical protein
VPLLRRHRLPDDRSPCSPARCTILSSVSTINLTTRIACARSSTVAPPAEGTGSIPDPGDVVSCRSYGNSLSGCVSRVSRQAAACFSTSG